MCQTTASKPTTPNLVVPNRSSISPLEEISDLDHLPLYACGADSSASYIHLPTGAARPRRTERATPLRLACWNSECAAGRLNWSIFLTST